MAGRETGMLEGGERSGRGEAGLPCCGSLPASHPAAAWGGAPSFPEPCWPHTFGVSLQLVSLAGVLEGRLQLPETGDLVLLLCPGPQRIPGARCPQSKGVGPACGVWSRLPRWSMVVGAPAWFRRPHCPGLPLITAAAATWPGPGKCQQPFTDLLAFRHLSVICPRRTLHFADEKTNAQKAGASPRASKVNLNPHLSGSKVGLILLPCGLLLVPRRPQEPSAWPSISQGPDLSFLLPSPTSPPSASLCPLAPPAATDTWHVGIYVSLNFCLLSRGAERNKKRENAGKIKYKDGDFYKESNYFNLDFHDLAMGGCADHAERRRGEVCRPRFLHLPPQETLGGHSGGLSLLGGVLGYVFLSEESCLENYGLALGTILRAACRATENAAPPFHADPLTWRHCPSRLFGMWK